MNNVAIYAYIHYTYINLCIGKPAVKVLGSYRNKNKIYHYNRLKNTYRFLGLTKHNEMLSICIALYNLEPV